MAIDLVLTVLTVGAVVAWTLWAIHLFPSRFDHETVICPERGVVAEVTFARGEKSWGYIGRVDVARCSRLPDGPVTCGKKCLK
jgi:hypothetical protein